MNGVARLSFDGAFMRVHGEVDFSSVISLEQQGEAWLFESAPVDCHLDLSGVSRCNSAGTALLLSWLRSARAAGKELTVENIPEGLRGLISLAGLETLLPASSK
jgi:phospholipid transport system transporter-binding protein